MTPSEPNSSIPRDANNSVLSASAKVFHSVVFDATNTDTSPNPPNVNNPNSVPEASLLTSEERACEDHFIDTHVRNEDGRYVVRLPFHSSPSKLEIRENQLFEDSNH
ncbi:hypothetical protein TNCV_2144901 [Trichonephila clavipes]|nr:hypothetical protein TNCV_2144901 [Trichonephila clavipes]